MNIATQQNTASDSVNNKALLVALSSSSAKTRAQDKQAAAVAINEAGADSDVGRFYKDLYPKAYTKPIRQAYNAVYKAITDNTLPYVGSLRILPLANYDNFLTAVNTPKQAHTEAVDALCRVYSELLQQAPRRLGKLYRAADFPPVELFREKFSLSVDLLPLPAVTDYSAVFGLSDVERKRIEKQAADNAAASLHDAARDAFNRLYAVVQEFGQTMRDENKIFRDSKVENIARLLDVLPRLNLTGDSELTARINEARRLIRYQPAQLRENKQARAMVADEADEILAKMASIL